MASGMGVLSSLSFPGTMCPKSTDELYVPLEVESVPHHRDAQNAVYISN